MRAILEVARWIGPERVTVIAGNHDRFNLYESIPSEPMEAFFDVVGPREPRVKRLEGGLALVEIDSNSDRDAERPSSERWLPNTQGTVHPEAAAAVRAELEARPARRVLILMHHHVSTDWYPKKPGRDWGGFMAAAGGVDALLEAAAVCDERAPILHGHIHDVMPAGHVWRGRLLSNPGGFAEARRINLLDWNEDETFTLTQIELR